VSTFQLLLLLLGLSVATYVLGLLRARAFVPAAGERVHSRSGYHGAYLAICAVALPLVILAGSAIVGPRVVNSFVERELPPNFQSLTRAEQGFVRARIDNLAAGISRLNDEERRQLNRARIGVTTTDSVMPMLQARGIVLGNAPEPFIIRAAYDKAATEAWWRQGLTAAIIGAALLGTLFGLWRMGPSLRARNVVERFVLLLLLTASGVAILTTFGIILSVLFESINFFRVVPPGSFFFGTVWDPRFAAAGASAADSAGQFGLLPLLWGTLFISFVALAVAVPIGLLSALYMAEYASPTFRNIAKPLLEILAGIPTIVYGFFALITFGPLVRDLGASVGLTISASSVLTAGIVMGIMIIPYVSSLSDDIITAVPQSLRDGAYALGATKSETIQQVVFPAALPGIVGAILLAASRAIGETMIVVLAAGIAAKLTINPFEAVTTMTVKIVSQLTGDLEFTSPQTLVAFALGLTLFVITLCLNIYALYVVRKYREQYE
jgi:phosphate transport system permease protein